MKKIKRVYVEKTSATSVNMKYDKSIPIILITEYNKTSLKI